MPKDDPSTYTPQQVAEHLLEAESPQSLLDMLDSYGWELKPTGGPGEESLPEDPEMEEESEEDPFEEEDEDDKPSRVSKNAPPLTILRMSAVDKAFKKHKKKGDDDGGY